MIQQSEPREPTRRHIKMPPSILRKLAQKRKRDTASSTLSVSAIKTWVSPDGAFCNTAYAADYIGRSISRLQSMRCEGVGPICIKRERMIYYRVTDLKAYLENGLLIRGDV